MVNLNENFQITFKHVVAAALIAGSAFAVGYMLGEQSYANRNWRDGIPREIIDEAGGVAPRLRT